VKGHGFRVESFEIARKDGGVFMHFSYIPPATPSKASETTGEPSTENVDLNPLNVLSNTALPSATSPGRLFLPLLLDSAKKLGGFPSWLGTWSGYIADSNRKGGVPGHLIYWNSLSGKGDTGPSVKEGMTPFDIGGEVESGQGGALVKKSGAGIVNYAAIAGEGRAWLVKGRQWTEVGDIDSGLTVLTNGL